VCLNVGHIHSTYMLKGIAWSADGEIAVANGRQGTHRTRVVPWA
jgi:hypothetical protein